MKIGIIVYSKTGHTYEAAEKIASELTATGHEAVLERILAEKAAKPGTYTFEYTPNLDDYDLLIFGSPVWAFSLCDAMSSYFADASGISGKMVFCFVTMGMICPFFGGTHAIRRMKKLIEKKGGRVAETAIIGWNSKKRETQIDDMAARFSREIQA